MIRENQCHTSYLTNSTKLYLHKAAAVFKKNKTNFNIIYYIYAVSFFEKIYEM